jgi:hypothetical protein
VLAVQDMRPGCGAGCAPQGKSTPGSAERMLLNRWLQHAGGNLVPAACSQGSLRCSRHAGMWLLLPLLLLLLRGSAPDSWQHAGCMTLLHSVATA